MENASYARRKSFTRGHLTAFDYAHPTASTFDLLRFTPKSAYPGNVRCLVHRHQMDLYAFDSLPTERGLRGPEVNLNIGHIWRCFHVGEDWREIEETKRAGESVKCCMLVLGCCYVFDACDSRQLLCRPCTPLALKRWVNVYKGCT